MKTTDYKRIGLIVSVVVCAALTWAAAKPWLESPLRFDSWTVAFWPALAVTILAAVASVAFALMPAKLDRLAALLASWAIFIFFWRPDVWYLSALPIFGFFWWEAGRRIREHLAAVRVIHIRSSLGQGVKFILLGAFLMVSVGFYLLPANREADIRTVSRGAQEALESAYDNPFVEEQLSQLPPSLQAQFKRDMARSVDGIIHNLLGPFANYVPPFLAFALFLALWSVSFIFREAALWLGVGLFWLLKRTGFVKIETKQIEAETIRI